MPMTFLKQPTSFGQSFAEGAGNALQRLASGRLQQIEQQNEQRGFAKALRDAYPNYSAHEASFIAGLPIEQRLKALESAPQPQQQGQTNNLRELSPSFEQEPTIAGAAEQRRAQELAPERPDLTQADALQLLQEGQTKQLQDNLGLPDASELSKMAQSMGYKMTPEKEQQLQQKLDAFKKNPELMNQAKQDYQKAVDNNETIEFRRPGYEGKAVPYEQAVQQQQSGRFQKPKSGMEKISEKKYDLALRKYEDDKATKGRELNKKGIDALREANSAAIKQEAIYDDIIKIAENPEWLRDPAAYRLGSAASLKSAFASFGLEELSHLGETVPQELLNKLTNKLTQGASAAYNVGQLNQSEFEAFKLSLLSAKNSPEGLIALAKNAKLEIQATKEKWRTYRSIVKENNGIAPDDVLDELEDRVQPKLNQLFKQSQVNIADAMKNEAKKKESNRPFFQLKNPLVQTA